jgi:hygromycin-B 4-O-kinase
MWGWQKTMLIVDKLSITNFLHFQFNSEVSEVALIGTGMFSQAFSFRLGTQEYVIRLNSYKEDFLKDAFADRHFASVLPIPKMIFCGQLNQDYYFAITERCMGRTLGSLAKHSICQILPSLFDSLYALHFLDTSQYSGWGLTDTSGYGLFASWEEYLRSFYNQKFSFMWKDLFEGSCMERSVYERYFSVIEENLPYCPPQKYWVHGDFGYDNVMSEGMWITGILDWAELRLGDFIYDIAYLEFWSKDVPYKVHWQEWAASRELEFDKFEQRMQCYLAHIGLASLAIASIHNNYHDYNLVKSRMQRLIVTA